MENKKKNRIIETYKYQSLLGEGSYGKVYLVRANISKKYYAMKTIDINLLNENQKKEALQEARILKKFIKEKKKANSRKKVFSRRSNIRLVYSNMFGSILHSEK